LQAWEQVLVGFNAAQTGGLKTVTELHTKYKNLKAATKTSLSHNAKEMKMTGGGSADIKNESVFNFSETQISGLNNKFDDDVYEQENITIGIKELHDGLDNNVFSDEDNDSKSKSIVQKTKYITPKNKRIRMFDNKEAMVDAKTEGIHLDNKLKTLEIEQKQEIHELEVQERKLRIQAMKVQIMQQEQQLIIVEEN
jgi:Myb/SANT-like DNA-binding domain